MKHIPKRKYYLQVCFLFLSTLHFVGQVLMEIYVNVYMYIYIHIVQYIQYLYKMQSHVSCGGGLGIGVSNFGLALLMTVVHLHEVSDLSVSVVCTYSCICIYAFLCIHAQFECESGHWSK